jgi:membrane protease YdiL (CAAX protease family)
MPWPRLADPSPSTVMMNQLPPPTTAPAGWYPDPAGTGLRYFDGRVWGPPAPVFEERRRHPQLPMRAAVGALVILVTSLLVGRGLLDLLIDLEWPVLVYVVLLGCLGYGPSVVWCWYVQRRWAGDRWAGIGWQFRWSDLGWGPLAYLAAIGTQIAVAAVVLLLDIPIASNVDEVSDLDVDRAYLVATVITAVVAAPVVEEMVFRGVVMRGFLSRMVPFVAIPLQGVLFGVAHVDPVRGWGNIGLAIVLSGVGIAFGAAAYLVRRVGATVIAHAIFNGIVMIIVLTGVLENLDTDLGAIAPGVG